MLALDAIAKDAITPRFTVSSLLWVTTIVVAAAARYLAAQS
jgi:hypothetical protein